MVDVCSSCGQADALRGLRCPVVTQHGGDGDGGKPCGHQFCVPCMRRFTVLRLRRRIWPMPCPKRLDDACAAVFARDTLIGVFGEESQDIIEDIYKLEAETTISAAPDKASTAGARAQQGTRRLYADVLQQRPDNAAKLKVAPELFVKQEHQHEHKCLSCYDTFALTDLRCAGEGRVQQQHGGGGGGGGGGDGKPCGHRFCKPCLRTYVMGVLRARTYPVPCPMGAAACGQALSRDTLVELFGEDNQEMVQELQRLEAEASIPTGLLLYCPHKDCSSPLLSPEDNSELPRDRMAACPACHRAFCPTCLVTGWHEGFTCSQYQALPPSERTKEDAAMCKLSEAKRWKRCPSCRAMIERTWGCNHIRCRCGIHFCYDCGGVYASRDNADRTQGLPTCACRLFRVGRRAPRPVVANAQRAAGGGATAAVGWALAVAGVTAAAAWLAVADATDAAAPSGGGVSSGGGGAGAHTQAGGIMRDGALGVLLLTGISGIRALSRIWR